MKTFAVTMNVVAIPERSDVLQHAYSELFSRHGIRVVPVPNNMEAPVDYLRHIGADGLILTGGNDVAPPAGVVPGRSVEPARDKTEGHLLSFAVENQWPVFGICRGMQFINCFFGGAVVYDITRFTPSSHAGSCHEVTFCADIEPVKTGTTALVNSFHNHGVTPDTIAPTLCCLAMSACGLVVEALRHSTLPIVGVQWHPERQGCSPVLSDGIVRAFLDATQSTRSA